jgi:nitrate/TMAO reductase-like tetraheme cytochrome c subunit
MALSENFDKKNKTKKKLHQRKGFYVLIGFLVGVVVIASLYQTSVYFSTNESCTICHVDSHATD